ncbi:MAG: methionyl-tRNA formyltransferase [Patescibacteria group bacterium]
MKKILFLGTPDFANLCLKKIIDDNDFSITVITQPDKPIGRKKILTPPPVAQFAKKNNLELLQPTKLKPELIRDLNPEIGVVVAYGKIIPEDILNIPKFGFINLHFSQLPDLRGPSPMQTALSKGYTKTGISIIKLDSGMDSGPILAQKSINIHENDNYITLSEKCAKSGANLLYSTLLEYLNNNIKLTEQDKNKVTITKIITRKDGEINLKKDQPQDIINKLRAFTPWPGIYFIHNNKRFKILKAHIVESKLVIDQIQPESKKPMSFAEFKKGHKLD